MPDALVKTLSERLSRTPAETKDLLHDFAADLKQTLDEDGEAPISGIGVFHLENGRITFEADPSLAHAANRRFAGLDPVRISMPSAASHQTVSSPAMADKKSPSGSPSPPDSDSSDDDPFELDKDLSDAIMNAFDEKNSSHSNVESTGAPDEEASSPSRGASEPPPPPPPSSKDEEEPPHWPEVDPKAESSSSKPEDPEASPTLKQTFSQEEPPPEAASATEPSGSEAPVGSDAGREDKEPDDMGSEYAESGAVTPSSVGPDPAPEPDPTPKASPNRAAENAADEAAPGQDSPERSDPDATSSSAVTKPEASSRSKERATRRSSRSKRKRSPEREGNSAFTWIIGLLILAALAAGIWYFLQPPDNAETAQQQQQQQQQQTSPAQDQPIGEPQPSSAPLPAYEPPTGLHAQEGGWTIVVASETSQRAAEQTARRYSELIKGENLPLGVVEGTVEGTKRYRVGVGQFDSQDELLSVRSRLEDRLPDAAWPLQLSQ